MQYIEDMFGLAYVFIPRAFGSLQSELDRALAVQCGEVGPGFRFAHPGYLLKCLGISTYHWKYPAPI